MRGKKKKLIEELETELEQLIANSGRSEVDIHSNYNAYCALKKRSDNPDSLNDNDDIRRMKDLHYSFQLGVSIRNRQNKINAARKVTAAAARPPLPLQHPTLRIPPYYHLHLLW